MKIVRIGQIQSDGQFDIVFSSESPISPIPYPDYKTPEDWESFLLAMYFDWDENWANTEGNS